MRLINPLYELAHFWFDFIWRDRSSLSADSVLFEDIWRKKLEEIWVWSEREEFVLLMCKSGSVVGTKSDLVVALRVFFYRCVLPSYVALLWDCCSCLSPICAFWSVNCDVPPTLWCCLRDWALLKSIISTAIIDERFGLLFSFTL
jgi:hypothetical protein